MPPFFILHPQSTCRIEKGFKSRPCVNMFISHPIFSHLFFPFFPKHPFPRAPFPKVHFPIHPFPKAPFSKSTILQFILFQEHPFPNNHFPIQPFPKAPVSKSTLFQFILFQEHLFPKQPMSLIFLSNLMPPFFILHHQSSCRIEKGFKSRPCVNTSISLHCNASA